MGREIKRVSLDFEWPLGEVWEGYRPPSDGRVECGSCMDATGRRSTGYSRLGNAIYASADLGSRLLPMRADELSESEIRFMRALNESVAPDHRRRKVLPYTYGGDTITDSRMASYDIMRHLAKTLHVPMEETFMCPACKGECRVVSDPEQNQVHSEWQRAEPPEGPGWQVWETVSEGSPITPVFGTADELIDFLCTVGSSWDQRSIREGWKKRLPTREEATAFVNSGWVPSAVISSGGEMYQDIQSATLQESPK